MSDQIPAMMPVTAAKPPPTRKKKASKRNAEEEDDKKSSRTGPVWWSQNDGIILEHMMAALKEPGNYDTKYDSDPECVDWNAIAAAAGMTPEDCQARWFRISNQVPKRRTCLDILRIVQQNFNGARASGNVLSVNQFDKVGNKRQRTIRLHDLYPDAPKRPSSAFFLWAENHRDRVKASMPDKLLKDVQTRLGEQWRNLPESEKAKFKEEAKLAMEQYHKDMEAFYNANPDARTDKKVRGNRSGKNVDPNAPPPPQRSGYHIFLQERRPALGNMIFTEAVKIIAKEWQSMPEEQKQTYKDRLDSQWETYNTQWEDYCDTLPADRRASLDSMRRYQPGGGSRGKAAVEPTRPTPYRIFVQETLDTLPAEADKAHARKALREQWKTMDEAQRGPYKQRADLAKQAYMQEWLAYKQDLPITTEPVPEGPASAEGILPGLSLGAKDPGVQQKKTAWLYKPAPRLVMDGGPSVPPLQ